METIKCKVSDLFELQAQLAGLKTKDNDGNIQILCAGFVNEKINEGTRRIANKALRILNTELEDINKQLQSIKDYKAEDEDVSSDQLLKIKLEKQENLLNDNAEIQIEKIDFDKIKDLSFSFNYGFLYEKLFLNY